MSAELRLAGNLIFDFNCSLWFELWSMPPRILIFRPDALGDLVTTFPLVGILRHYWPSAQIDFLVQPLYIELLGCLDGVNQAFGYYRKLGSPNKRLTGAAKLELKKLALEQIALLKSKNYDLVIAPFSDYQSAKEFKKAGIPYRLGRARRLYSWFFNLKSNQKRHLSELHEAQYGLNMLQELQKSKFLDHFDPKQSNIGSELKHSNRKQLWELSLRKQVKFKLNHLNGLSNKINSLEKFNKMTQIMVHPLKTTSSLKWSEQNFAQIIEQLLKNDPNILVHVTGIPAENQILHNLLKNSQYLDRILISTNLSIPELLSLMQKCKVWIGNSTGPMHLAAWLGLPVVALFGRAPAFIPRRWGPIYSTGNHEFTPEIPACRRCIYSKCGYYNCIDLISVEKIYQTVEDLLKSQ